MGGKGKFPEVSKKVGPPQTPRSPNGPTSGSESDVPRSRSKDDADKSESKIKKRSSRSASVTSGDKVGTDLVGLLKKPPPVESSPIPPSTEPSNALLQELWKTSKSNSESIAKMADVMKCLTEQQIVQSPRENWSVNLVRSQLEKNQRNSKFISGRRAGRCLPIVLQMIGKDSLSSLW